MTERDFLFDEQIINKKGERKIRGKIFFSQFHHISKEKAEKDYIFVKRILGYKINEIARGCFMSEMDKKRYDWRGLLHVCL